MAPLMQPHREFQLAEPAGASARFGDRVERLRVDRRTPGVEGGQCQSRHVMAGGDQASNQFGCLARLGSEDEARLAQREQGPEAGRRLVERGEGIERHDQGTDLAPRAGLAARLAERPALRRCRQRRGQLRGRCCILTRLMQDHEVEGRSRREVARPIGPEGKHRRLARQPRRDAVHDRVRHAAERASGFR